MITTNKNLGFGAGSDRFNKKSPGYNAIPKNYNIGPGDYYDDYRSIGDRNRETDIKKATLSVDNKYLVFSPPQDKNCPLKHSKLKNLSMFNKSTAGFGNSMNQTTKSFALNTSDIRSTKSRANTSEGKSHIVKIGNKAYNQTLKVKANKVVGGLVTRSQQNYNNLDPKNREDLNSYSDSNNVDSNDNRMLILDSQRSHGLPKIYENDI